MIDINNLVSIRKVKLFYKGQNQEFDVYRVPISKLFYNDQNGRIGTFINRYNSENPANKIDSIRAMDIDKYNNIIAEYIKNANAIATYNKTKESISKRGQQINGVILDDGRVLDGNRRFTCLRELYAETGDSEFEYFETIILPYPQNEDAKKSIKKLEIYLQHGQDEKVDYTPIQRLVDVYNNLIIHNHLLKDLEYQNSANLKSHELKKLKGKAEIMADFCHFFNMDEKFYIVDELALDGPIEEVWRFRMKLESTEKGKVEWQKYKPLLYTIMLSMEVGDLTREIRDVIKSFGKPSFDKLYNDEYDYLDKVYETAKEIPDGNEKEFIKSIRAERSTTEFRKAVNDHIYEERREDSKNKPVTMFNDVLNAINKIDSSQLKYLGEQYTGEIRKIWAGIKIKIEEIGGKLNDK